MMRAPGVDPMAMPPAAMQSRIATTPPWQLSEQDFLWAQQNGMEDLFWARPTIGAVA